MGVIMMAGTLGWIIEAPAATAYAVLPVGVDTITPEKHHMQIQEESLITYGSSYAFIMPPVHTSPEILYIYTHSETILRNAV